VALGRLVHEARGERPEAVDELLTLLRPGLLAFFRRKHSVDRAEDLTQVALIRITRAIPRIAGKLGQEVRRCHSFCDGAGCFLASDVRERQRLVTPKRRASMLSSK
jgi:hypothetical protein